MKDQGRFLSLFPVSYTHLIARIREWERLVSMASKRGASTFFPASNDPTTDIAGQITPATHGIDRAVEWAMTSRGGRQFDMFARLDTSVSYTHLDVYKRQVTFTPLCNILDNLRIPNGAELSKGTT